MLFCTYFLTTLNSFYYLSFSMSCEIIVEGLPAGTQETELREFFGDLGSESVMLSLNFGLDPFTGKPTGSARCKFLDADSAAKAVDQFNDKDFKGTTKLLLSIFNAPTQISPSVNDPRVDSKPPSTPQIVTPTTAFQPPKISIFSGDPKLKPGECSFECWKYEVTCLLKEGAYSHQILTPIIRRSLRGEAGQVVRYLGSEASINEIISKLEGLYGTVESGAVLLQQLYQSKQDKGESAAAFGLRLELLANKAKERGGITQAALNSTLRIVFWQGLVDERVKNTVRHKIDQANSFDEVLRLIRVAEQEIMESERFHQGGPHSKGRTAQTFQTQTQETDKDKNDKDLQVLLKKIEQRLATLEKTVDKGGIKQNSPKPPDRLKDRSRRRGPVTCYGCGQEGHIARNCPNQPNPEKAAWHLNGQGTLPGGGQ